MRTLAVMVLLVIALRLEAVVAVINERVMPGELTTERVRDMLLGRVTTWPSGNAVVIVLCTSDPGDRAVAQICSRSVSLLQRGWKRLVFSGTGAMPLVIDTPQAAMDLVGRTPGAILVLIEAPPAGAYRVIELATEKPGASP
jgi:hypothetical protein